MKPELICPAADASRAEIALAYGADAVCVGLAAFGASPAAPGLGDDELGAAAERAHAMGRKLYVALDAPAGNDDMNRMSRLLGMAAECNADAFLTGDLGVMAMARQIAPFVALHYSPRGGVTNYGTATAAWQLGATRVALSPGLTLQDIAQIRGRVPETLELSAWVHGGGTHGCAAMQPGVLPFPCPMGQMTPACRVEGGACPFAGGDLCMAPLLDVLAEVGVNAFFAGTMEAPAYETASLTWAYRRAVDALAGGEEYLCPVEVLEELTRTGHRRYSTGGYLGRTEGAGSFAPGWQPVAVINGEQAGRLAGVALAPLSAGEKLEALVPGGEVQPVTIEGLQGEGDAPDSPIPAGAAFTAQALSLPPYTVLRREKPL